MSFYLGVGLRSAALVTAILSGASAIATTGTVADVVMYTFACVVFATAFVVTGKGGA